jgi:DNA repair exonuclease SbcCD ATPase subunit
MLPIKLKIENFFSHKNSEIDFSLFNSALLLGNIDGDYTKSNGSGKSAIMESMLWCLYNKSRATTMDDVITWGENKCCVSLQFSHLNNNYLVKRTRMKATSTSTVELMILDSSGSWKSLSASTSGETNDKIVKLLKIDYKTFVNSAYFRQNDISEFAISEASKRKEILKSIIDISKWDLYEKDAKKRTKEIQTETIKLQAKYDSLRTEVESLSQSEEQLLSASAKLSEKTKLKASLQERREALSERYLKIKNNLDTESWDRTSAEISSQKILGKDLKLRYEQIISPLQKRLDRKESIISKISSLDKKIKTLSFDPDVDSKIEKISSEIIEYSGAIQQSKVKIKEICEVHLVEGECFTCKQSIDSETFEKLKEENEKSLEHYSMKKTNSEKRVAYLFNVKNELQVQKSINSEIEKATSDKAALEAQLIPLEEEILSSEKEKKDIHERMFDVKQKISEGEKILSSLKDETFQSLHEQLKETEGKLESVQSEMLCCGILVGSLTEKTKSLSSKKIELEEIKKAFDIKSEEMALFEKLTKMFGKTGIQTILLDAIISDLETSANRILSSICSEQFAISLPTQRVGSDGVSIVETLDLNVKKDGAICGFSSLSGGEQFRIALSLRIALSELATQHGGSSLEFLLLDEINSPLDKSGVETLFVNIIKHLEAKYKILVITHDDSLKERFDNVIDVSKTNGDSFISFATANITT